MRILFLCILLLGIPFSQLVAQPQVNALDAGLELVTTQQTIPAGESPVFEVRIGESAPPLANVIGFDLEFELYAGIDPACILDFSGSCLPASAQGTVLVSYTESTHTIQISLANAPSFTAGGLLFSMELGAVSGPVNADQVINSAGGFMIVEDIGFKLANDADAESGLQPVVFPTHCRGMLHFDWQGQQPESVMLVDVRGAQVVRVPEMAIQRGSWATAGLESGLYKVVVGYEAGQRVVRNVWVE